jgi:hypothetical protein
VSSEPLNNYGKPMTLDMNNPKDQAFVHNFIKRRPKRWRGVTEAVKDRICETLEMAAIVAQKHMMNESPDVSLKAAAVAGSVGKTIQAIEGQNQADEHMEAKNERLDSGKATENIGILRVLKPDVMKPKE